MRNNSRTTSPLSFTTMLMIPSPPDTTDQVVVQLQGPPPAQYPGPDPIPASPPLELPDLNPGNIVGVWVIVGSFILICLIALQVYRFLDTHLAHWTPSRMLKKSKKELMIIKKRIDAMDIERRRLLSFSPSLSVLVHDWFVDFERMVPVRTPEEAMAHYVCLDNRRKELKLELKGLGGFTFSKQWCQLLQDARLLYSEIAELSTSTQNLRDQHRSHYVQLQHTHIDHYKQKKQNLLEMEDQTAFDPRVGQP